MSETTRYFIGGVCIGALGTVVLIYVTVLLTLAFRRRR